MLVLLETAEKRNNSPSSKRITWYCSMVDEKLCGANVKKAVIALPSKLSDKRGRKRVKKALEALRYNGYRMVAVTRGFAHNSLIDECCLYTSDLQALRRALAPSFVRCVLSERFSGSKELTAAVYATRPTRELNEITRTLFARFRTVAVKTERGGERFAAEMYARHGVTVVQNEASFSEAALHIHLGAKSEQFENTDAFVLDCNACGATLRLPERFDSGQYDPLDILCALHESGVIETAEIEVLTVDPNTNTLDIS